MILDRHAQLFARDLAEAGKLVSDLHAIVTGIANPLPTLPPAGATIAGLHDAPALSRHELSEQFPYRRATR
jgi:hypothetical protein